MASLVSQSIGVIAVVLGIAWVARPMTMITLQYRVLYFWSDPPDTDALNETLARASGLVLAAFGAALAAGILP